MASRLYQNALLLHGDVSTRHVDVWERPRDATATCGLHSTEAATLSGRIKMSTSGGSLLEMPRQTSTFPFQAATRRRHLDAATERRRLS